jgi:hypothetical protein
VLSHAAILQADNYAALQWTELARNMSNAMLALDAETTGNKPDWLVRETY